MTLDQALAALNAAIAEALRAMKHAEECAATVAAIQAMEKMREQS